MAKRIPDRWFDYTKIGQQIDGTRFVAFKTPLADSFGLRGDSTRFSPNDLLEHCPDLGLVIDLTNTTKYYSPDFLRDRGLQYAKVWCEGMEVPREDKQRRFFEVVDAFERGCRDPRALVGVHCTHGVNRTGFLVCAYMIRRLAVNPRDAIDAFAAARGHRIERQPYVHALLSMAPDHARTANSLSAYQLSNHPRHGVNVRSSHVRLHSSHSRSNNFSRPDSSQSRSNNFSRPDSSQSSSNNVMSSYASPIGSYCSNNVLLGCVSPHSNNVVSGIVRPNDSDSSNFVAPSFACQNDTLSRFNNRASNSARQNDFQIHSNYFMPNFSRPRAYQNAYEKSNRN